MSQGTYKITEARQGRTYTGKHGDLVVWLVKLENAVAETPTAEFELHKKPGNTPNPGDTIEVDRFAPGEHDGTAFVRIFVATQSRSAPPSSTGGGGRSPDQQRSIVRQHSQEMALRLIDSTGYAKDLPLDDPHLVEVFLNHHVRRITDWFAQDANGALESAPAGQPQLNGGEVPADTTGLQAAAPSTADESIPF